MLGSGKGPWVLAAGLMALGCGNHLHPDQTAGELGNGAFRYVCVGEGDALCPRGGRATNFPERVATTGVFDVEFEPYKTTDLSAFDIVTVASGVLEEDNNAFRAKAPGTVALLAKRTSDGRVIDFVHLEVLDVSKIRLESGGGLSPLLTWHTGEAQTLKSVPEDDAGSVLAGSVDYEWTTSDERIVRLERANPTADMELMPRAPGPVTISVTGGGHTDSLSVTVEGRALAPDGGAGDASAPDGSTDRDAAPGDDGGGTAALEGGASPDAATEGGAP